MKELKYFPLFACLYIGTMLTFNIVAVKLWQVGPLVFTAGILLVPVTYIFGDILTEVYGYARTRQIIWIGFACNALMILAIQVAILLPAAEGWKFQEQFTAILQSTPRIATASLLAYLAGEFTNSYVMAKMKIKNQGNRLLLRCLGSTAAGQFVDTVVFVTGAFLFVMPSAVLFKVILTAYAFKLFYEVLAYPITKKIIRFVKERGVTPFFKTPLYKINV
jgi:uncharacterized integral membrane protein (TIGR00697 family)